MAETTIDRDLLCRFCGYNLRGISRDGRCPECGKLFAETVAVKQQDAQWLRRVSSGALVLATALALIGVGAVLNAVDIRLALVTVPFAGVLEVFACREITAARPHSRARALVSGNLVFLSSLIAALILPFSWILRDRFFLEFLIWALAFGAVFSQLAYVARIVRNRLAAAQAMSIGIIGGTSIAVLPRLGRMFGRWDHPVNVVNVSVMMIAGVWGIVFLINFANELRAKRAALLEILKNENREDSPAAATFAVEPRDGG